MPMARVITAVPVNHGSRLNRLNAYRKKAITVARAHYDGAGVTSTKG
jgi:hypothetical protein